jgi:hypothetical protein
VDADGADRPAAVEVEGLFAVTLDEAGEAHRQTLPRRFG